ncbi:MAG TPA: tRNA (adenosine(37)-N6)-threonylcarbamoyltransferase complex dimerization subunit type 1 TsaB [Elusimicrobia bacterium]|nr:tRNA (adenosine(37)-N6)-threonylcarbamoyltransferase complex dimerization subunit type 1 TsaB [Elusimicrobiota bacterium]
MRVLVVDTTADRMSLALWDGTRAFVRSPEPAKPHDETLFGEVDRLLKKAGLRLDQVEGFAAACGPGRFTGIRIGMTYAAVSARALGRPAAAVSLLEALAFRERARFGPGRTLWAVLPGIREEVYFQGFARARSGVKAVSEPRWAASADEVPGEKLTAEGSLPGAADLLPLALQRLKKKASPMRPLYLKPAKFELTHGAHPKSRRR